MCAEWTQDYKLQLINCLVNNLAEDIIIASWQELTLSKASEAYIEVFSDLYFESMYNPTQHNMDMMLLSSKQSSRD
jgi:hypothetical protein